MMDIKSPVAEARNEYTYSASGAKLKAVQKWNPNYSTSPVIGSTVNTAALTKSSTTDYAGNIIYENSALKRILVDGGYYEGGNYYFYITDHLGNNRIVANAAASVVQSTQYYPFGTPFADASGVSAQPYKYNGKELDSRNGLNMYDYSARQKDDWRFISVDPVAEMYYSWSPYAYCLNNPLLFVDENGMWPSLGNIKKQLKEAVNTGLSFVSGAVYAVADNAAGGYTNIRGNGKYSSAKAYNSGQDVGDIVSVGIGAVEMVSGGTKVAMGIVGAPETAGATLVGSAVGVVEAVHGAFMAAGGIKNFSNQKGRVDESNNSSSSENSSGGGKNAKHANQKARDSATKNYEQVKLERDQLKSKPNKTPEDKKQLKTLDKQVDYWKEKKDFTGENHNQNAKGNR